MSVDCLRSPPYPPCTGDSQGDCLRTECLSTVGDSRQSEVGSSGVVTVAPAPAPESYARGLASLASSPRPVEIVSTDSAAAEHLGSISVLAVDHRCTAGSSIDRRKHRLHQPTLTSTIEKSPTRF